MGGKKVCAWLLANCEVQLCSALAAMSLLGVVVVCPVMLDPAIETLASTFEDAQCRTVYSRTIQGMSNCTWTSCREGCTADIYSCWHIIVVYMTNTHLAMYQGQDSLKQASRNTTTVPPTTATSIWSMSSSFTFERDYDLELTQNLTSGLHQMLQEINLNIQNDTVSKFIGIAALYPNQQKCVYSPICTDYYKMYGKKGGPTFPCFVSLDNLTMVVTTVDKVGALRNIFYCFIPLIIASAVFTYLFYRVGLIGDNRNRLKGDEESDSNKPSSQVGKNGLLPNGAPPGAPKKLRKKFLPKRKDSSKKRRARKNLKKNMSIKNQLSIKSASSSRRTPSISMAGLSDDVHVFSKPRTSVPRM